MIIIDNLTPTLIQSTDGSWLAVAGPDSPVRTGAWGDTKEQAIDNFDRQVTRVLLVLTSAD